MLKKFHAGDFWTPNVVYLTISNVWGGGHTYEQVGCQRFGEVGMSQIWAGGGDK